MARSCDDLCVVASDVIIDQAPPPMLTSPSSNPQTHRSYDDPRIIGFGSEELRHTSINEVSPNKWMQMRKLQRWKNISREAFDQQAFMLWVPSIFSRFYGIIEVTMYQRIVHLLIISAHPTYYIISIMGNSSHISFVPNMRKRCKHVLIVMMLQLRGNELSPVIFTFDVPSPYIINIACRLVNKIDQAISK